MLKTPLFSCPALDFLICIAGPTASGKTAAALMLAEHFPVEIISMDSAAIYSGMDIGTSKPNAQERALVPHHLLDIIEPTDSYSVATFIKNVENLYKQIISRNKIPILVGGTMLYYKTLSQGLSPLPEANCLIRSEIYSKAKKFGWPNVHTDLIKIDPITAARLAPNDSQRIVRALEIHAITGKTMSDLLRQKIKYFSGKAYLISLEPNKDNDRKILYERIKKRFIQMLEQGLIEEVISLRKRYKLNPNLPSMRCVGYRQIWHYLEREITKEEMIDKAIVATRHLAKHQLTWLRSLPDRYIINCDNSDYLLSVLQITKAIILA